LNFRKLLVPLFLALFACASAEKTPPNSLVIGVENGPNVLDPRFATDAVSSKICDLMYSGLFRRDKNLKLVPLLAESVDRSDATSYIIRIRKGIRFHDGRELTSADVFYTFQSILDPATASPKRSALSQISYMAAPHPYTLVIKLKEPYAPFLGNLTIGIVPDGSGDLTAHPIGTGPFRFQNYKRGEKLYLKRFDGYFARPAVLDGVIFKIVPDETVRLLELKKGNVHIVSNPITPAVLPWLEEQKNIRIMKKIGTNVSYIGFNLRDPILKNLKVREAVAHAIDRKAIAEHLMKGLVVETESIIAPSNVFYNPNLKKTVYDPALARKLLEDAGYPDPGNGKPRFTLTYKTSKNPTRKKIAEIFGEQLRKVGIELEIKSFEWGTFFADIKSGNFQVYSLTWVGIADPDIYHYIFHSSSVPPNGANRGGYSNPALDKLLEKGRRESSFEKRKTIYDEAQKIIAEDFPYVHLWVSVNVAAVRANVKGFELYPDESLDSLVSVRLED
jgi:peptide/nickel transport system substrate-binding protein